MIRRSVALLLALTCSVQSPQLARAGAPDDVDARAKTLFDAGDPLGAAQLWVEALDKLPEGDENRQQRSFWATRAVNSYQAAFEADPTQCTAIASGLAVAEDYLGTLKANYGVGVTSTDEYVSMQGLHGKLEGARTRHGCPMADDAHVATAEDAHVATAKDAHVATASGVGVGPGPAAPTTSASPDRKARGLAVGFGVSAALAAGMTIGSAITYVWFKEGGRYHDDVKSAADGAGIDTTTTKAGAWCNSTNIELIRAECDQSRARRQGYYAMTALAGVFAVSTAVFTGLLIHHRRKSGPLATSLRHHQVQFGAMPHRGGGASLTAGFRF